MRNELCVHIIGVVVWPCLFIMTHELPALLPLYIRGDEGEDRPGDGLMDNPLYSQSDALPSTFPFPSPLGACDPGCALLVLASIACRNGTPLTLACCITVHLQGFVSSCFPPMDVNELTRQAHDA
jgi:hypothetical protein